MSYVSIYITTANKAEAERIGTQLVEKRLAACVNIIPSVDSIYRWEGKVENATEAALIAKTTEANVAALTAVVKALHSYSCPCLVSTKIAGGSESYLKWIGENVLSE